MLRILTINRKRKKRYIKEIIKRKHKINKNAPNLFSVLQDNLLLTVLSAKVDLKSFNDVNLYSKIKMQ